MLAHLNFNTNLIVEVPSSLFSLQGLKLLDISYNKIKGCFTEAIGNCSSLVEFRAAGNMITELPDTIGNLMNLEVLDMRDNKI